MTHCTTMSLAVNNSYIVPGPSKLEKKYCPICDDIHTILHVRMPEPSPREILCDRLNAILERAALNMTPEELHSIALGVLSGISKTSSGPDPVAESNPPVAEPNP